MSLNQRRRFRGACHQTSLHPTHHFDIFSANPTCWELVPEGTSALELRTDEQLHNTQAELQRYRMLYDNMPSIYLSLDVTGLILSVNQFGASCLGYAPEQLVQQPIFTLFAESEKQRVADKFTELLTNTPKNVINCEDLRLDCPLSQMKRVKVTLRLIADDFPEPLILMVCEDSTANLEKGKPPKFRNSLQLEQLPSLGRQCVGETRGAALPTCSTCRRVSRLVATADIEHEEELPRHLSATKSAGGYKFVSMAEESLENPVLIAKQPGTTKSLIQLHEEFIGAVSHELRTPLTNMKMAIQMLGIALSKEKKFLGDADSSKMACYLEILNNECDREINLIDNFLDLKRLETNSQPLVLETIHIQEWLWQVVEKFKQHHFQLCQQHLSLDISPSLPPLRCNSLNLERIFMELLTNACKFSPPDAAIIISAELKANQVFLQVTNSGVEIPSTELPRIFDKFYRIPSNDPAKQGGTGLGLALVQKLTKQLGGTITVESRSNRTCFTLVVDNH